MFDWNYGSWNLINEFLSAKSRRINLPQKSYHELRFQLFNELSTTNLIKCPALFTALESISHLASREKTAKTSKNALWSSKKRKNWTLGAYVYKYWLCSVHNCSSVFSDHSVCAFSYQHSHFDQKSLFLETGFLMSLICFSRADAGKASIWGWEEDQMDLHSYASV